MVALLACLVACPLTPSRDPSRQLPIVDPIFDRALAAVAGGVVDEQGLPIEGAAIEIAGLIENAQVFRTDSDGQFVAHSLPSGNYELVISTAARGRQRLMVWLPPGSHQLSQVALLPEIPITGHLVDGASKALAGVVVAAFERGLEAARATTDAKGRFAIAGLPAGRYELRTVSEGLLFAQKTGRVVLTPAPSFELRALRLFELRGALTGVKSGTEVVIELLDGTSRYRALVTGAAFALSAPRGTYELFAFTKAAPWRCVVAAGIEVPAAKRLKVELATCHALHGVVKKEGGGTLAGAMVSAMPDAPSALRRGQRTDATGRFVIGPLPAGKHRLEVWAADLLPDIGRMVSLPHDGSLVVTLSQGRQLRGVVTDEQQRPVADALVRAVLKSGPGRQPIFAGVGELGVLPGPIPPIPRETSLAPGTAGELRSATTLWSTTTTADGAFRLSGLPPAIVRLHADHRTAGEGQSGWMDIREQPGNAVVVQLSAPHWLEGIVRSSDGRAISGAEVFATPVGGSSGNAARVRTDHRGHFRVVAGSGGKIVVRVQSDGYLPLSRVADTAAVGQHFVLEPLAGQLHGMVLDDHGMPVGGATVKLLADRGGQAKTHTDSSGRFTLPGVAGARAVRVVAEHAGFASTTHRPRPSEHLYLRLKRLKPVEGRVQSERLGTPVERFTVTVAGSYSDHAFLRGAFSLSLPPGTHRLVVRAKGFATGAVTLKVDGDAQVPQQVTVALRAAGTVTGVAHDATGQPISGAAVLVGGERGTTNAEGRFSIGGVAEGTHTLTVTVSSSRQVEAGGVVVRAGETTGPLQLTFPP